MTLPRAVAPRPGAQHERVAAAHLLAVTIGRLQVAVEAAVHHDEGPSAGPLPVDDAGHVHPGLTDQEPAELEDHPGPRLCRHEHPRDQVREALPDHGQVERVVVDLGDAEAPAEVEVGQGLAGLVCERQHQGGGCAVRLDEEVRLGARRPHEQVEALEPEVELTQQVQHGRHLLDVHPELVGFTASSGGWSP